MKNFEPIAIIGQGCILPGCTNPEELWQMVFENKVNISGAYPNAWRVDMNEVIVPEGDTNTENRSWNDKGGYITGFDEIFDSSSFEIEKDIVKGYDSIFKWSFYAAQAALKNAGYLKNEICQRTGLIMGNLSYPSRLFSQYFEEKHIQNLFPEWKNPAKSVDGANRFMSGLPSLLTAKALGLKGDVFALDAACASSLYALSLGCEKLHNGREDMMLIGGVCASDQLFLHVGFTALNALSPSGQSRPFNKNADGLVPSEGAGFIVIKRLENAVKSKDTILGVIRGIGLSNDGKQGGFLSPSQVGQVKSMKKALSTSGIQPEEVSYIECHATGTSTGDSIEIKSMQEVYENASKIHLGSLKGNIGHTITVSGVGSILKVLGTFKHKILPPTPNAYPLNDSLANTIFSIKDHPTNWESDKNRIAGISNFGFGGNNAHVLIEEWNPKTKYKPSTNSTKKEKIAVIGVEIQSEKIPNSKAYLNHLIEESSSLAVREELAFNVKKLSSPPNDLKYTLSQQLLILHTAQNLLDKGIKFDKETTGVFIGMGTDAEINRYGFKKRIKNLLDKGGVSPETYDLMQVEESIFTTLNAPTVLGTMPNIPANRINNHFDFSGIGFTVSCEELSGIKALNIAIDAIQRKELTSALVGAVDISNELVHKAALEEELNITLPTSDAALIIALKSYDQAIKDGDVIYATIGGEIKENETYTIDKDWVFSKIGYSHTSSGLIDLATAILLSHHRLQLNENRNGLKPLLETSNGFSYDVHCSSLFGSENSISIHSEPLKAIKTRTTGEVFIHCYSGNNIASLLEAIKNNIYSENGNYRLGIVSNKGNLQKNRDQAIQLLQLDNLKIGWLSPNIHYRNSKINGEIAFVFTGAASAYSNMGKELVMEFPGLITNLHPYCTNASFAGDWIFENDTPKANLPFYQLAGSSLLCQVHANFTKHVLKLIPQAAIGLSSGETNSMFALGVWNDMDGLLKEIYESELYDSALGVDFNSVKKHWKLSKNAQVDWMNWRVLASVSDVKELLKSEEKVYLTIINTKNDCVIGGDRIACERIIQAIGTHRAMPLNHDIAVHCEVVKPYEKSWRTLHTRKVNTIEGIRFYSNYLDGVYVPTSESVADALTGQAIHPIDFPKIIEKAWIDGVRVFIEHGPRNSLNSAIREILKDKEFLSVSLDRFGQSGLMEALRASTELWCSGIAINLDALRAVNDSENALKFEVKFPFHMPEIVNKIKTKPNPTLLSSETIKTLEKAPQIAITSRRKTTVLNEINTEYIPEVILKPPVEINSSSNATSKTNELFKEPVQYSESNSVLELLKNQHRIVSEAHDNFIKVQLNSQQYFSHMMQKMMQQIMGNIPGNDNEVASEFLLENHFKDVVNPPDREVIPAENVVPERIDLPIDNSVVKVQEVINKPIPKEILDKNIDDSALPGPKFSREQLEVLSSGKISSVLGTLFEEQDNYAVQVRMPEPPLLLCDRVTGIIGVPGTLGLGTIFTETDVKSDSWYLHNNRMPPGIFIEAGQADLLLISYLGIDFKNKGERAYRLLGCELTFFGELPQPGDTLKYDIHVDGYAKSGDTTLFFFHYDCHINGELRISVRSGQAGFFSRKELDESKGVIWDPKTAKYVPNYQFVYGVSTIKKKFSFEEIEAYTKGDMVTCFGQELGWTQTHTRSPRSQGGYQNFIKNITEFDLNGGPAKRGYLRSETIVSPNDWYFKGHFKNDPCMPGTLMADACLQMMAFFMVGAGLTLKNDGWRFEPVTGYKCKFICRGQVIPESKKVTYEIFVDELIAGDYPTIFAHVLATVDGNKAFLCERIGLRLVPDWPLLTLPHLMQNDVSHKQIATYKGFKFGYESLINCALGNASNAFGPEFNYYNGAIRSPRLPGPPYHFMTRIFDYKVIPGNYKDNPYVIAEYDIPKDVWYFDENGSPTMPYAVLMEVALQPCGWLSTFICQYDIKGKDLLYRNLDGKAIQHRKVTPQDKTIVTKSILTSVSIMGEIIIVKFDVISSIDDESVFTMNTVFGFFDSDSMTNQKGLAKTDVEQANLALKSNYKIDLTTFPKKYFHESTACLPASKLLMIDRIVSFYPKAGKFGKGYIKSEKDVEKSEWFFKAHFFQDPVQPGSLGIEAMVQLMQFYIIDQGFHKKFKNPILEPIAINNETEWHYRGQVTPDKKLISVDFEIKEIIEKGDSISVFGEARLWVDGLKIYHAPNIGMSVRESK